MRDWEEQNRVLRVEREKAIVRKKQETEKRLRELQDMVEEKRKEREDKLEMLRNRKVLCYVLLHYIDILIPLT